MWLTPAKLLAISLQHKQCQDVVRILFGKMRTRGRMQEKNKKMNSGSIRQGRCYTKVWQKVLHATLLWLHMCGATLDVVAVVCLATFLRSVCLVPYILI